MLKQRVVVGVRNGHYFIVDAPKDIDIVIHDYDFSKLTDDERIQKDEDGDQFVEELIEIRD